MLGWYFSAVLILLTGILIVLINMNHNTPVEVDTYWFYTIIAAFALLMGSIKEGNKKGDKS